MLKASRRQSGFTLMEVIFVIAIAGIIAYSAMARTPGKSANLRTQADRLVSDLRYTQNLAITKSTTHYLEFTSNKAYSIRDAANNQIDHPATGGNVALDQGLTLTSTANSVYFNDHGKPYTDPTLTTPVSSANPFVVTISSTNETQTVTVRPETGHVFLGSDPGLGSTPSDPFTSAAEPDAPDIDAPEES